MPAPPNSTRGYYPKEMDPLYGIERPPVADTRLASQAIAKPCCGCGAVLKINLNRYGSLFFGCSNWSTGCRKFEPRTPLPHEVLEFAYGDRPLHVPEDVWRKAADELTGGKYTNLVNNMASLVNQFSEMNKRAESDNLEKVRVRLQAGRASGNLSAAEYDKYYQIAAQPVAQNDAVTTMARKGTKKMATKEAKPEETESAVTPVKKSKARKALGATGKRIGEAAMSAAKRKAASKAADGIVQIARTNLPQLGIPWPAFLDTPGGRQLAKVALPLVGLFLCEALAEKTDIPLLESVKGVCGFAVEGVTEEVVGAAIEAALPMLAQLSALGAGVTLGAFKPVDPPELTAEVG